MKAKLLVIVILLAIAVPVWGGAFVDGPIHQALLVTPETKVIERMIVMKESKEIKPLYGITLGFVNDYPLIGYSTPDIFIEAGAKNVNGDTSMMILAGGIMQPPSWITLPKYARARIGIALNPGATGKPGVGLFAGLEKSFPESWEKFDG